MRYRRWAIAGLSMLLACSSAGKATPGPSALTTSRGGDLAYRLPAGWTTQDSSMGTESSAQELIRLEPPASATPEASYRIAIFVLRARGVKTDTDAVRQGLAAAEKQGIRWTESHVTLGGTDYETFDVTNPQPCPTGTSAICVQRIYVGAVGTTEVQVNYVAGSRAAFDAHVEDAEAVITSFRPKS